METLVLNIPKNLGLLPFFDFSVYFNFMKMKYFRQGKRLYWLIYPNEGLLN